MLFFCISILCKHGPLPFDQKFRHFRNGDKWYGNFLGKVSENTEIVLFPKASHSNENPGNPGIKVKWNGNFQEKFLRKFGYTSRGCPLFRNLCKFLIFFSALASSFGRDHSELDISCKDDSIKESL